MKEMKSFSLRQEMLSAFIHSFGNITIPNISRSIEKVREDEDLIMKAQAKRERKKLKNVKEKRHETL